MAEVHDMRTRTDLVVLDIGGDIGALILYTSSEANGDEIEISPRGQADHRSHNQVHEREFNGKTSYAAIYPELIAGEYDLWDTGQTPVDRVTIVGGPRSRTGLALTIIGVTPMGTWRFGTSSLKYR